MSERGFCLCFLIGSGVVGGLVGEASNVFFGVIVGVLVIIIRIIVVSSARVSI